VEIYYEKYCKDKNSKDWHDWPYVTGDAAVEAADGYFRVLGRVDDVINVAGHRLGTKELESAALTTEEVAEAAVVPVVDELRGKLPVMYVALKPSYVASKELEDKVKSNVVKVVGPIGRPSNVYIVPDMPKTRSGKIMRRVLTAISNYADIGDTTTLANPEVVEIIRKMVQGEEAKPLKEVPEEIKRFGAEG
jgi:acetyl-CoA synthetase